MRMGAAVPSKNLRSKSFYSPSKSSITAVRRQQNNLFWQQFWVLKLTSKSFYSPVPEQPVKASTSIEHKPSRTVMNRVHELAHEPVHVRWVHEPTVHEPGLHELQFVEPHVIEPSSNEPWTFNTVRNMSTYCLNCKKGNCVTNYCIDELDLY